MPESCKCKDHPETCKNPNITLPPLPTMKANLANAYKNNPGAFPDGFSLDDALNTMDDNYKKADDAVAAFNSASDAGLLGASDTMLADGDDADAEAKRKSEIAMGTARSTASEGDAGIAAYNSGNRDLNLDDLLKKMRKERGDQIPARAVGLNLEDGRSGRLLSLFERVSRAIRGPRDRDVVLAKMEWSRREILKKLGKTPAIAAPHSGKNSNFAISSEKQ